MTCGIQRDIPGRIDSALILNIERGNAALVWDPKVERLLIVCAIYQLKGDCPVRTQVQILRTKVRGIRNPHRQLLNVLNAY